MRLPYLPIYRALSVAMFIASIVCVLRNDWSRAIYFYIAGFYCDWKVSLYSRDIKS